LGGICFPRKKPIFCIIAFHFLFLILLLYNYPFSNFPFKFELLSGRYERFYNRVVQVTDQLSAFSILHFVSNLKTPQLIVPSF
jgi:hypothetical protein